MNRTAHTPAITQEALRSLGGPIREALRNLNYVAAESHIRDIITSINHESAWCFDTDPDLPHMAAYFGTLHDACARIRAAPRTEQKKLSRELISTIDIVLREMTYHLRELVEEEAPDTHPSIDEVGLRGRRYEDLTKAPRAVKVFD